MQRKKSRFLVFLLSFIPGAGEMYMGFMKMGLSLMLGFMILAAIVGLTNLGALAVFPFAMYAYSFFHANNLATLDDRVFHSIRDEYLFGIGGFDNMKLRLEGRNRKVAAGILIVLGVMMLWQVVFNLLCDIFGWDNWFLSTVYYFVRDELPRAVVGIGVIWIGLAMIRGKRIAIEDKDAASDAWTGHGEHWSAQDGQMGYNGNRPESNRQGEQHEWQRAEGAWTGYERQPAADGKPVYGEGPAADGRIIYGEGPVADGRIIYGEGPVANGRVSYEEGSAVDGRELPENRK